VVLAEQADKTGESSPSVDDKAQNINVRFFLLLTFVHA